jgi:hypothetical protein
VHSTTRGGRRPMLQSAPRQALSDCRRHGRVLICRTDGDDLSDIYPAASQRPTSEFRLFLLSTTIAFNQPSAKPRRSPKWFSRQKCRSRERSADNNSVRLFRSLTAPFTRWSNVESFLAASP